MTSSSQTIGSMDALLTSRGKLLQTGESVRLTLVKGPTLSVQKDPVSAKAPSETFPQVLKFGESVERPDFRSAELTKARLYQQNVPKAQEDQDEEVETSTRKRKWQRHDAPKRQWILQEQKDFLESMILKRQGKPMNLTALSSRYEGTTEANSSAYVIMSALDDNIRVTSLPTNAVQSMSQPAKRQTMSMSEAEQAIQDARGKMTRYMMHHKNTASSNAHHNSKSRLLDKLAKQSTRDDDEDDVMGDVAFRSRKASKNSRARRELLSSLAEEGMTVDDDGVLGGTNDAEFGGKRHFGRYQTEKKAVEKESTNNKNVLDATDKVTTKGNDGLAMADDFYQRDVEAEYEELDYDANELFDDDDVDLGEGELMVDASGFAADNEDDQEDDDLVEDGEEGREGAEGLATVAGFRALLAKARGETVDEETKKEGEEGANKDRPTSPAQAAKSAAAAAAAAPAAGAAQQAETANAGDALAAVQAAAAAAAERALPQQDGTDPSLDTAAAAAAAPLLDANGNRLITLEAIRNEIWLHHGKIPVKRLMKIFETAKKTPDAAERRAKFRDLIKELCIMKKDAVDGNILILKQHYSRGKK